MKTLEEVIKAVECCLNPVDEQGNCSAECPFIASCDSESMTMKKDVLHYLKEYKELDDTLCALPDYYEWLKSGDNDPLSWDELKEMVKKPVWVETFDRNGKVKRARWAILDGAEYEMYQKQQALFVYGLRKSAHFAVEDYGKTWQAYKKERTV